MSTPAILNERYQLLDSLGNGGMALVYKAKDLMLERPIAVKLLREDYSKDLAFRERFRQEARAAANLTHPNIVTVHDFGLDQGHLFIVMEYVPGQDLKSLIRQKGGSFTVQEALELSIQACQGVGYAHRAGLVHCDIKPHNMLVTPEGRLKVTDFGIARALASIDPDERSEVVWGSPHYFSPEQAAGLPPSPASDVYSLGVILYELLTGNLPFTARDSADLARMHREAMPKPPRLLNLEIPQALDDIVMKVLSKEPTARYRTADQLGRVLQTLYESNPALRRPNSYLTQGFNVIAGRAQPFQAQQAESEDSAASDAGSVPVSHQELKQEALTLAEENSGGHGIPAAESSADVLSQPGTVIPGPESDTGSLKNNSAESDEAAQKDLLASVVSAHLADDSEEVYEVPAYESGPEKPVDWVTWLLALAAFVLLFGLIPFWMYISWSLQR